MNENFITTLEDMIPELPVVPKQKEENRKKVRYFECEFKDLEKYQIDEVYYCYVKRWEDKQGYYLTNKEEGASWVFFSDYNILEIVKEEHGKKEINGDIIFEFFDMFYDEDLLEKRG